MSILFLTGCSDYSLSKVSPQNTLTAQTISINKTESEMILKNIIAEAIATKQSSTTLRLYLEDESLQNNKETIVTNLNTHLKTIEDLKIKTISYNMHKDYKDIQKQVSDILSKLIDSQKQLITNLEDDDLKQLSSEMENYDNLMTQLQGLL